MNRFLTAAWLVLIALTFSGCNTVEGVGRDIEQAGRSIQKL